MTPNPFALSLSKGQGARHQGFDKLSPNGINGSALTLPQAKDRVRVAYRSALPSLPHPTRHAHLNPQGRNHAL